MKKENLFLIINTALMIIVGLVFVTLATRVVPNSPKDYLFNKVIELKNEEIIQQTPEEDAYGFVYSKQVAHDSSGKVVGDVYTIIIKNDYGRTGPDDKDGYVELYVGIDQNDKLSVQIETLAQSSWTVAGIQRYINLFLQNVDIDDVDAIAPYDATDSDLMSGMTATETTNGIKALVLEVIDYHNDGLPEGPTLLNVNLTIAVELNATFDPTLGIKAYDIQDGDLTDSIEIIGFNPVNLTVIGSYTYTVSITDSDDNTTSATVTLTVVGAEVKIFDSVFGNGYIATQELPFGPFDMIIEKYMVTNSELVSIGSIYKLTGSSVYNDDEPGDIQAITIYVALDLDNTFLAFDVPSADYFHSKGGFLTANRTHINGFIGTSLNDVVVTGGDLLGGATGNSKELANAMLGALKELIYGLAQEPTLEGVNLTPTAQLNGAFDPYLGITALDLQDGDLTDSIEVIGFDSVNLAVSGTYTYTVSITDSDDNTTSVIVTLSVVGAEVQIFDSVFGNGYIATQELPFGPFDMVIEKYTVTNSALVPVGTIYKLTGSSFYNSDEPENLQPITIYVALSLDNTFLAFDVPSADYFHSKGGYLSANRTHINGFVGTSLNDVVVTGGDLLGGVTANSKELANAMLAALKEVVLG
jgi:hypothetical protein